MLRTGLSPRAGHAVIGLSRPRGNKTFSGLELDRQLAERRIEPKCGIYAVALDSGDIRHALTIEGIVSELYDVAVMPGKLKPAALGPASPEVKHTISIGPSRT